MQIDIPEFTRSPYSLLVVLSVAIGFAVAIFHMHKFKVEKRTVLYTCLLTFICTLTTSLMVAFKISTEGIELGFSGLGAVVGMIAGIFISGLIIKDKPDCVMASFVATAPLMYGLAKLGCFFAGCCHGKPYEGPLAVTYHNEHAGSYFPVQIFDMLVFILVHIIAVILIRKMKNKVSAIYIIMAILVPVRFLLEYLRYYHDGSIIASGQIKVLIAGALAVIIVFVWKKVLKINYH